MAKRVGIIGYPIGHSISPIFQQAALDYYSLDTTYHAWELEPKLLPDFIKGLRTGDTLGINVTVPHKEAVMAHLDYIDERAEKAGAVNTVVNDGGKLTGHNTDGSGFLKALKEHRSFSPGGRRVLIIGAGGSAKAVALALAHEGVATIDIANRTLNRAQRLAELLNSGSVCGHAQEWPTVNAIPLVHQGDVLVRAAARSDLVVNCTTLGMKNGPDENSSPLQAREIPSHALVYDLVYNPPETPLLREAAKAGATVLGGLPMLVYQGAASFEFWTGKKAPVELMLKAAKSALT